MIKVILCEGKTDAILLSYYLGRVAGWQHVKAPKNLDIKPRTANESVYWYKHNDDLLMICAVGGKDNFISFFQRDIENVIVKTDAFARIAIVLDRDNRKVEEIEQSLAKGLVPFFQNAKNCVWTNCKYTNAFGIEKNLEALLLVIPREQEGALETVMLEAISEDEYDRNIVDKCTDFVADMRGEADRYIRTDRLQLKARLSTVWAIQSPEKVFTFIDEQIKAVQWERYDTLRNCFEKLVEI